MQLSMRLGATCPNGTISELQNRYAARAQTLQSCLSSLASRTGPRPWSAFFSTIQSCVSRLMQQPEAKAACASNQLVDVYEATFQLAEAVCNGGVATGKDLERCTRQISELTKEVTRYKTRVAELEKRPTSCPTCAPPPPCPTCPRLDVPRPCPTCAPCPDCPTQTTAPSTQPDQSRWGLTFGLAAAAGIIGYVAAKKLRGGRA